MFEMEQCVLNIAGISIRIKNDLLNEITGEYKPFVSQETTAQYEAYFEKVVKLRNDLTNTLYKSHCYCVHLNGNRGYLRSFFDAPKDSSPYAIVACDYNKNEIHVEYLEKGEHCISEMSNSFFHLGIEAIMIRERRLCFHAACVNTYLGGILFSGPSGIGKSTQADLWCRYKNAKLINGDRPILSKEKNGFLAWGSPYAGSSKCYVNENCSVAAIVMLRQSESCHFCRLNKREAFKEIYKQLTVYSWDRQFVEMAIDLAINLVSVVPVYEFACTPDEYAVEYLERELKKDWNYG